MMMLLCLFITLFILCFATGMVFMMYMCMLWTSSTLGGGRERRPGPARAAGEQGKSGKGLSTEELERLGGAADGGAVAGQECTVCLEDIEEGQLARVLPECRHAFHRPCADRWLSAHAECPLCRAHLRPPPSPTPPPPPEPALPPHPALSPPVPLQVVVCA